MTDKPTIARVVLGEWEFRELVEGRSVKQNGAEIILSDIGFSTMLIAVRDAAGKSGSGGFGYNHDE